MKFAKLIRIGGELIEASQADYSDYKGFLICPECNEPVFLRKAHKRGDIDIPDAFIHHVRIPEVSICEQRVGRYSYEDVKIYHAKAQGQRLATLKISLWKFLKTNLAVRLTNWNIAVNDAKNHKFFGEIVDYAKTILKDNNNFIIENTPPRTSELLYQRDSRIGASPEIQTTIFTFIKERSCDWRLHYQITKEALELFLNSPSMEELRNRLCCLLCHPTTLEAIPELLVLDTATKEWRQRFVHYLTLEVPYLFLLIDWVGVWNSDRAKAKPSYKKL